MGAYAQAFGHTLSTARTVLAGERGWHGDNSLAGACCLAGEDGAELRPARIRDAFGEVLIVAHVGHPQLFESDSVVGAEQIQRRLRLEVAALAGNLLVLPLQELHGLAAALAALLAAGDAPQAGQQAASLPSESGGGSPRSRRRR